MSISVIMATVPVMLVVTIKTTKVHGAEIRETNPRPARAMRITKVATKVMYTTRLRLPSTPFRILPELQALK